MIKIMTISAAIILTLAFGAILFFKKFKNDPFAAIKYAKKRKGKKDVSLIISRNNSELISINPHIILPLASTVKIVIAIEYARQVNNKMIDEDTMIPKEELLKYYIDQTDGGAHKRWVEQFNNKDCYTLKEITIGMIAFSSNANTEFLLDCLGINSINKIPATLNLNNHSTIFPIVSSLYIPSYISFKEQITSKEELLKRLTNMPADEYINNSLIIHGHLKKKENHAYMEKVNLDYEFQKVWSDRLPASSASDYLKIMKIINSREQFNQDMQSCLEEILGYSLYLNKENRKWVQRGGFKGGSTLFVFTYAAYATDKEGNQTEIVFFSNNLNALTAKKIQLNLNRFVLNILTDESFRNKLTI